MFIPMHFKKVLLIFLLAVVGPGCATLHALNYENTDCVSGEQCSQKGKVFQYDFKDMESAVATYEKGCKLGNADSCDSAGFLYGRGLFGDGAGTKATEFYRKACEIDGVTCVNYAGRLCLGDGTKKNAELGLKLAKKSLQSSTILAYKHHIIGVCLEALGQTSKAELSYAHSCQLGGGGACDSLEGLLYDAGKHKKALRVAIAAVEVLSQSCFEYESPLGCAKLQRLLNRYPKLRGKEGKLLTAAAEKTCLLKPRRCQLDGSIAPGDLVYVPARKWIYLDGPSVRARGVFLGGMSEQRPTIFRVIENQGVWLKLLPADVGEENAPDACTTTAAFDDLQVPVWVKSDILVPILQQDFRKTWPNGTSIEVRAGFPLLETKSKNLYTLQTHELSFRLELKESLVAKSFKGNPRHLPPRTRGPYEMLAIKPKKDSLLTFGKDGQIELFRSMRFEAGAVLEDKTRVTLKDRCLHITALADSSSLTKEQSRWEISSRIPEPTRWILAGAKLRRWEDGAVGSVAGTVARRHLVSRPKRVGEYLCFHESLAYTPWYKKRKVDPNRQLDLCVRSNQFEPAGKKPTGLRPPNSVSKTTVLFCGEHLSKETTLKIKCEAKAEDDFSVLRALPWVQSVKLSGVVSAAILKEVSSLPRLRNLHISNQAGLDLRPLRAAKQLKYLVLENSKVDFWPERLDCALETLKLLQTEAPSAVVFGSLDALKTLTITGKGFATTAGLEQGRFELLSWSDGPAFSLDFLRKNAHLKSLYISDSRVADFLPLSGHPSLEKISANRVGVSSLSGFQPGKTLKSINLSGSPLSEEEGAEFEARTGVEVIAGPEVDFCGYSYSLTYILVRCSDASEPVHLTPLVRLRKLKSLYLSRIQLVDPNELKGLKSLEKLVLVDTPVPEKILEELKANHPTITISNKTTPGLSPRKEP